MTDMRRLVVMSMAVSLAVVMTAVTDAGAAENKE